MGLRFVLLRFQSQHALPAINCAQGLPQLAVEAPGFLQRGEVGGMFFEDALVFIVGVGMFLKSRSESGAPASKKKK